MKVTSWHGLVPDHQRALLLLTTLTLVACGVTASKQETEGSASNAAGSSVAANGGNSNGASAPASTSPATSKNAASVAPQPADANSTASNSGGVALQGSQPVAISGLNLLNYEDAVVSCQNQVSGVSSYLVTCAAMVKYPDGTLVTPTSVAPGMVLQWALPAVSSGGTVAFESCPTPAQNALTFSCVVVANGAAPAVQFGFNVQDQNHNNHGFSSNVNVEGSGATDAYNDADVPVNGRGGRPANLAGSGAVFDNDAD